MELNRKYFGTAVRYSVRTIVRNTHAMRLRVLREKVKAA
jgi:hypothetical protein